MMISKAVIALSIFVGIATTFAVGKTNSPGGCDIPIGSKKHFRYQWPLIYNPNGKLYATEMNELNERHVIVQHGAEVLLSCGPNYLKNFNKKELLKVKCNGASGNFTISSTSELNDVAANKESHVVGASELNDLASSKGIISDESQTEMSIKELTCDLRVIEEVLSEVDGCVNEKWTATAFGYIEPTEKLTHILGEACYDTTEGKTIFTHVKMGDKDSNYLQKVDKSFLTSHQHPDGLYKIELFRGLYFDEIYERIRSQIHTKHTPKLRMSNFIDEPLLANDQFQAVKKLGWNYFVTHDELEILDILKNDIKELSGILNLDVYVGSHGVQVLHGRNNEKMQVYLHPAPNGDNGRFPMPKLIWILVKHQRKATVFGIFNDAVNDVEVMRNSYTCRTECNQISWLSRAGKAPINRNSIICCSYEEMKDTIQEIPTFENIKEILN